MGHILPGTQDVYYNKTKVEDLRQKYARVNFFPEKTGLNEDSRKRQIIDMAKVFGYSDDKIKKIEDLLARQRVDDAIREIRRLREDSNEDEGYGKTATAHNGNGKYLIAHTEDELIEKLHEGYKLIQSLGPEKFLLETI